MSALGKVSCSPVRVELRRVNQGKLPELAFAVSGILDAANVRESIERCTALESVGEAKDFLLVVLDPAGVELAREDLHVDAQEAPSWTVDTEETLRAREATAAEEAAAEAQLSEGVEEDPELEALIAETVRGYLMRKRSGQ